MNDTLTAVAGLRVGHWTDRVGQTGCTVILCPPEGCVASVAVCGSGPASRETALLAPEKSVQRVHAVVLSGGSAFGLDAAGGVMRWLEERGRGFNTPCGPVPIVPAAAIYDLWSGDPRARPGCAQGYRAAQAATSGPVDMGRVGAGTGAKVGSYRGIGYASPGGLGSASAELAGATVAVLAVVNAGGNVVDPHSGRLVAGVSEGIGGLSDHFAATEGTTTTLVIVATDAPISKAEARLLAGSAQSGLVRAVRPVTLFDGDTCFVLSTASGPGVPLVALSLVVQELVARAIVAAVSPPP